MANVYAPPAQTCSQRKFIVITRVIYRVFNVQLFNVGSVACINTRARTLSQAENSLSKYITNACVCVTEFATDTEVDRQIERQTDRRLGRQIANVVQYYTVCMQALFCYGIVFKAYTDHMSPVIQQSLFLSDRILRSRPSSLSLSLSLLHRFASLSFPQLRFAVFNVTLHCKIH